MRSEIELVVRGERQLFVFFVLCSGDCTSANCLYAPEVKLQSSEIIDVTFTTILVGIEPSYYLSLSYEFG